MALLFFSIFFFLVYFHDTLQVLVRLPQEFADTVLNRTGIVFSQVLIHVNTHTINATRADTPGAHSHDAHTHEP